MRVDYNQVYCRVKDFREAIDIAKRRGMFEQDGEFKYFPADCCGSTCILLAEFLMMYGIKTLYVLGENYIRETHAWLIVKDDRIRKERQRLKLTDNAYSALKLYGSCFNPKMTEIKGYDKNDLLDALGIDITADQFGKEAIHVGEWKKFEVPFKYKIAQEHYGLSDRRYIELYKIITSIIFKD